MQRPATAINCLFRLRNLDRDLFRSSTPIQIVRFGPKVLDSGVTWQGIEGTG